MIYTGYFSRIKDYKGECFSIARYTPTGVRCGYADIFFPPEDLLFDWKLEKITQAEYTQKYSTEVLEKIDVSSLKNHLDTYQQDIFLLCYEKPGKFCHRHLVSDWLNSLGIPCKEKD